MFFAVTNQETKGAEYGFGKLTTDGQEIDG
jgi:hypothetical protein